MPPRVATKSGSHFSPDTNSAPAPAQQRNQRRNLKEPYPDSSPTVATDDDEEPERGRSRFRRPSETISRAQLKRKGYHVLALPHLGKAFHVEQRFKLVRELGHGAYGTVISAQDEISGEHVAIKQVPRVFDKISLAKRALREITLLRHFSHHDNITGLIDMDVITKDFNEIYLFMEPMEADLHQIIRSEQGLTNAHVQYFTYQILRGLKFIHSAGVIHRDLKPGNLLVNADCQLKICDFGLSRGYDDTLDGREPTYLTEYVATRWYRAPEIMLSFTQYGKAIDIWSVGCIMGELLAAKPLFKGKDYVDQLNKIIDVLGTPSDTTISSIRSERARKYVRSLPRKPRKSLTKLIPSAEREALELLSQLVQFEPEKRPTVSEALEHPWLSLFHDTFDEPVCLAKFDRWRFVEELATIEDFRDAIWKEVQEFRDEARRLSYLAGSRVSRISYCRSRTSSFNDGGAMGGDSDMTIRQASIQEVAQQLENTRLTEEAVDPGLPRGSELMDPIASYGDARRASMMLQTVEEYGDPLSSTNVAPYHAPTVVQEDGTTYVRPRTTSVVGGKMLRSLSTISVHEVAGDAGELVAKAPVGRYITEKSAAEAPISELPREFGDREDPLR